MRQFVSRGRVLIWIMTVALVVAPAVSLAAAAHAMFSHAASDQAPCPHHAQRDVAAGTSSGSHMHDTADHEHAGLAQGQAVSSQACVGSGCCGLNCNAADSMIAGPEPASFAVTAAWFRPDPAGPAGTSPDPLKRPPRR